MSLNEEQFRDAIDLILKRTMDGVTRAIMDSKSLEEMIASIPLPDIAGLSWAISRPEAVCIEHDVTDRVREIHGDIGDFVGFYLTEIITPGVPGPSLVYGWGRHKGGDRIASSKGDPTLFDHVQQALDEKVVELDLRDPATGELLVSDGPNDLTKVEHRLSDVVVKDIDAQVEKFSSELDAIFGDSPDPGWAPPAPPGGG